MKPEVSIGVGLATGAVVASVYFNALPPMVDVRVGPPQDQDVAAARKAAAWTSAGIVAGISLIAKDPTVFAVGAAAVIVFDWWYRHANAVDPRARKATVAAGSGGDITPATDPGSYGYLGDLEPAYY